MFFQMKVQPAKTATTAPHIGQTGVFSAQLVQPVSVRAQPLVHCAQIGGL